MKVAVVGSRSFRDYELMKYKLSNLSIAEIVSGGAMGADKLAERYAKEMDIPVVIFYPEWSIGKHAGLLRNTDIVRYSDIVYAFWDGHSPGTADSIQKAISMGKPYVITFF